jgi:hypothetical protein
MRTRPALQLFLTGPALGVLFASFYAVARPDHALSILAGGALTGLCISISIAVLEGLFNARIESLRPFWRLGAKSLQFFVGGLSGWIVGMSASSALFGFGISFRSLVRGNWMLTMGVTGGVAVVVGFAFYAYELLENRLARTIVQLKEHEWAEKELELAREIQTRLLPPERIDGDGFTITARNLPARMVAGDFYDVVRLDDGSVVIAAADVAGKGIGASLIMASVKAVLPFVAREGSRRAMSILNEKLVRELGSREFVALAYAHFRPDTGALEIVNAGFPDPYIVSANGARALENDGTRLPLGVRIDVVYTPLAATLLRGERLVFVSDGIPEAPVADEPLGYERMQAMLATCASAVPAGALFIDVFLDAVRNTVDAGLADDWTAVVVER